MLESTFEDDARRVVSWMAAYRSDVHQLPVVPTTKPGDVARALPSHAPMKPESLEAILADFERVIVPGMTHWNHPRFFAYFPANTSEPSILGEMLTATLGAQCMSWQTSPAATELEQVVLEWLRDLLVLPVEFHGVIQDTASSATLVALLMAREIATDFRFREEGAAAAGADRLRVYASSEAHSSIDKAVFLSGIGQRNLRRIPVDDVFAMIPHALAARIDEDRRNGLIPAAVVATIGSTSSTAIDPLPEIAAICRDRNVFLHVDAAYAGNAAILPEHRGMLDGIEHADSFVFNPHKWLFTNFDCSAHYVRDKTALLRTCAIQPEYLKTTHDAEVANFRDWGIPLGRRFRALKLWMVLRRLGVAEIQRRLREAIRLGEHLRARLAALDGFEVVAPSPLALVCFRALPGDSNATLIDAFNEALMNSVNQTGSAFVTQTRLNGQFVLRAHTAQEQTREEDVDALVNLLVTQREELLRSGVFF